MNKTYLIFVFVVSLVLLGFIGYVVLSLFSPAPPQQQFIAPSITPFPTNTGFTTKNGVPSSPIERTVIGETTEEQIAQRSDILARDTLPNGETKFTVQSPLPLTEDEIYTKNGVVVLESTSIFTTRFGNLPTVSAFEEAFGAPEEVVDNNQLYGWFTSAYLFPENGYVVIANRFTREVYEVIRFTPMELEEFKNQYGEFLEYAPSPQEEHYRIQ